MPSYFSAKQERMYEHIRASGLSKGAAAATVNKYRTKHKLTKKSKRRRRSH
jgi:hypothetical protein